MISLLLLEAVPPTTTWAPVTESPCNDTIYAGECLYAEQSRFSCNNCFQLRFQADSNLVVYTSLWGVVWAANLQGRGGVKACMQLDGNFAVSSSTGQVIWSSGSSTPGSLAQIQDDARFVVMDDLVRYDSNKTSACVTTTSSTTTLPPTTTSTSEFKI